MPHDIFDLTGKVALITGASSGFGAHFARVLIDHGASVALVARRADELERVRTSLLPHFSKPDRGEVMVYPLDVRDGQLIGECVHQVSKQLGDVTVLINNAGIGHLDRAVELDPMIWHEVLQVDLCAPFYFAQALARQVNERSGIGIGASIINVASIFGQRGSKGMVAYATAKAGLEQMTRALATEWAALGIRVNALAPGWFVTDMTRRYLTSPRGATIAGDVPLGRFGIAGDLDGAVLLLASDAGRYITGSTITIDGGLSVAMRDGRAPARKGVDPAAASSPERSEDQRLQVVPPQPLLSRENLQGRP